MVFSTQNKSRQYRRLKSGIEYNSQREWFDGWVKFVTITCRRGLDDKQIAKSFHKWVIAVKKQYNFVYAGVRVFECSGVEGHYHLIVFTDQKLDSGILRDLWFRSTDHESYIVDVRSGGNYWAKGNTSYNLVRYVMTQYMIDQDDEGARVHFIKSRDWLPKDAELRWKFLMRLYPKDHYNKFKNVKVAWQAYLRGFAWNLELEFEYKGFKEFKDKIERNKKQKKEENIVSLHEIAKKLRRNDSPVGEFTHDEIRDSRNRYNLKQYDGNEDYLFDF